MKKYNKEYIAKVDKTIREILNDTKEFDDWTQFSLTIQNAVQAAANVFGLSTDEDKHKMAGFLQELVYQVTKNLQTFDITFKKKDNG